MVLAELQGTIMGALKHVQHATIVDDKVVNECLNEISRALLQSDVQFKLVRDLQTNIKNILVSEYGSAGHDKRNNIEKVTTSPSFSLRNMTIYLGSGSLVDDCCSISFGSFTSFKYLILVAELEFQESWD